MARNETTGDEIRNNLETRANSARTRLSLTVIRVRVWGRKVHGGNSSQSWLSVPVYFHCLLSS